MLACPMCPRLCFAYMYVYFVHVFGAHMNACVDECATAWGHERQQALECSCGVNGEPSRFHSPLWHALSEISHHIKFVFHCGYAQLDPYLRLFSQSWACEIGCHLIWAIQFQRSACGSVKGKKNRDDGLSGARGCSFGLILGVFNESCCFHSSLPLQHWKPKYRQMWHNWLCFERRWEASSGVREEALVVEEVKGRSAGWVGLIWVF